MEGIQEIGAIWQGELRRALRSPRTLVLVLLYFFFSALTLIAVSILVSSATDLASAQAAAQGMTDEAQSAVGNEAKLKLLSWLFGEDPELAQALSLIPLVVPLVFKITLLFLPAYAALMGFDQLSGEIEHRSIRYLAVRARRSSILLGKFAAQATVLVSLILIVDGLTSGAAKVLNPEFEFSLLLPSLLRFWVAATIYSVAYVALTSLCSSLFSLPAVSLIFNLLALFGFWLVEMVGSWLSGIARLEGTEPSLVANIKWLSPMAYSDALLHPAWGTFGLGVLAFAAFAAAFLGLAWANLRRRDV